MEVGNRIREERERKGISQEELVSRGEYFAARLMADYLGFDFLDAELWLKFKLDGTVDQEETYENIYDEDMNLVSIRTSIDGVLRVEGKEYVVKDGDVIEFRFNVSK